MNSDLAGKASRYQRPWTQRLVVASLAIGVLALGCWQAGLWWARSTLDSARRDFEAGRYREARESLARLTRWRPRDAGVLSLLGDCERELGDTDAALRAWSSIPKGSPLEETAALRSAGAELDRGRLSAAEAILRSALESPGDRAIDLRHELLQIAWQEGRLDEVRSIIERNWNEAVSRAGADSPKALSNLRAHLSLDLEVFPVDRVREILDRAAKLAPDDDGVALGRANLATRTGQFDEARRWLEVCRQARPDAPQVLRAALELGMATNDDALAAFAARLLTTDQLPRVVVTRARAWFAARQGDSQGESVIWREHVEREPSDTLALERLAELAIGDAQVQQAAEWRRRKTEIDRVRRAYGNRVLTFKVDDAESLAEEAERLGRLFEAKAFLALAYKRRPNEANREGLAKIDAKLSAAESPGGNQTLAEVVGSLPAANDAPTGPASKRFAFIDDARASGLDFWFQNGRSPRRQLPETMSGGVGLLDYDGDGDLDVYCVQGGPFPPDPAPAAPAGDRLFRNAGGGRFEDATARAGLPETSRGYGHGVAVGDVDNDGRPDLLVTRFGSYALYRNAGGGRFEDATRAWGLSGGRDWPTSAAFADLDGDGDLDLYVAHYITWDAENPRLCGTEAGAPPMYCSPHLLPHAVDRVYRNEGGRFVDVTDSSGVRAADVDGRGLGVVAADFDEDGRVDLFVANDGTANFLFRNLGDFRFEEVGLTAGAAANAEGGYQAGMGIGLGDLDGDGRLDLVVTNFYGESTSFFRSLGPGLFGDRTSQIGLREPTRYLLGFGTTLADFDNDGHLDLATANGHVNDSRPVIPYAMPARLMLGSKGGQLRDVSKDAGEVWGVPRVGRGLATGDLDNDGRLDLVLVDQDGPMALFRNRSDVGHFAVFRLEGRKSNRDAVGTKVEVKVGAARQVLQRHGGGSYQSANDARLHVGLGEATRVEEVVIHWPSGQVDRHRDLPADAGYLLSEGSPKAEPLIGFPPRSKAPKSEP